MASPVRKQSLGALPACSVESAVVFPYPTPYARKKVCPQPLPWSELPKLGARARGDADALTVDGKLNTSKGNRQPCHTRRFEVRPAAISWLPSKYAAIKHGYLGGQRR